MLAFLDSDTLLDIVLYRQPFFGASAEILDGSVNCITSVHTILNVHYIAKKVYGETQTRIAINALLNKIKVVPEDSTLIRKALNSNFSDFEDAVQYFAAKNAGATVIITRNIKDYKNSAIPVLTAEQFLRTVIK